MHNFYSNLLWIHSPSYLERLENQELLLNLNVASESKPHESFYIPHESLYIPHKHYQRFFRSNDEIKHPKSRISRSPPFDGTFAVEFAGLSPPSS